MVKQSGDIIRLNEKLEDVEIRKERLRRFWAGEDLGRPPISFIPHDMTPRQKFDADEQFARIAPYMLRIMELPGDTIPTFWPDQGTIALASVFGGEITHKTNNKHT